ncbi:MAG: hypothetical protein EA364_16225 [Balneolaceae bacterium]|nr:MAG: hypothetical protein EA364_16225 [Balneolaceae bacterium]
MARKYLIPSLFYLIVTLVSGCYIRLQWAEPSLMVFNPKFLIHSHSHVAMLGWLFLALAGLISQFGMNENGRKKMGHPLYLVLLHTAIAGMTIAFALQGYAFYSILLSTLFIILSLWFAFVYFSNENMAVNPLVRNFLNAAVFWMVFSSVGPLALAGGTMMGPDWIQGWVAFYLHLQFNGWITFALAGLLIAWLEKSQIHVDQRPGSIAFWLLFIGVFPSMEPLIRNLTGNDLWIFAGIGGATMVLAGTLLLAIVLYKYFRHIPACPKVFIFTALASFLLKSLFHAIASIPGIGDGLTGTHLFAIGFVHLLLLGFASTAILWLILSQTFTLPWNKTIRTGSWILIMGIIGMVGLLFVFGMYQYLQIPLFLPVQWLLFGTGLIVLAGGCIILYALLAEPGTSVAR